MSFRIATSSHGVPVMQSSAAFLTLALLHSYKTSLLTKLQTVSGTTQGVSDVTKGAGNTVRDGAGNLSGQNKQTAENPLGLSDDLK